MLKRHNLLFIVFCVLSFIFLSAIAFNYSPYLRGPAPYPPDWQWTYQFTNTLSKIWFPLIILAGIFLLAYKAENLPNKINAKSRFLILGSLILLGFLLQISLLFYSRGGIAVIIHRIIDPTISGYFTASLNIHNLGSFLSGYNQNLTNLPMYAKYHPPGAILFFWIINNITQFFSFLKFTAINSLPSNNDVALIWEGLKYYQKETALLSGFIIAFITTLSLIPLYFCSELLYGGKTAIRSIFLFALVPSILLFIPLNDTFMPIFTLTSLYYFLKAIKRGSNKDMFISGFILFCGVFFDLTFLPLLFFYSLLYILYSFKKEIRFSNSALKLPVFFTAGFVIIPLVLLSAGLNFFQTGRVIMGFHEAAQHGRQYQTWVFYNLYDFFLFLGIFPALLFFQMIYKIFKSFLGNKFSAISTIDPIFLSLVILFLALDISGSVRGETARIWIPYVPLFILVIANFITKAFPLTRRQFLVLMFLQALQIIVFQTVLVTIW
jgi:hypothetical protein